MIQKIKNFWKLDVDFLLLRLGGLEKSIEILEEKIKRDENNDRISEQTSNNRS